MPRAPPSSKALNAILPLIASNQPYEAHQKARTFASRYVKAGQYSTAIDVLFQSARELFKIGQQGSGTDLTVFLLEAYESAGVPVDGESRGALPRHLLWDVSCNEIVDRVTQLLALVGPDGSWRKTVAERSLA
jgi:golgi to ER traffic protein 4